jgi:hypothetical protein
MAIETMNIIKELVIDAGEKDDDGNYDFYYEFEHYQCQFSKLTLLAKSYKDEPELVSFYGLEKEGVRLMPPSKSTKEIQEVISALILEGKLKFTTLSEQGYVEIIPSKAKKGLLSWFRKK